MTLHQHLTALRSGRSTDDIAAAIGGARSKVFSWFAGTSIPSARYLRVLLREVGLPEDDPETWRLYAAELAARAEQAEAATGAA